MSRTKGTFDFSANIEPIIKAPLDARQKVENYADLLLAATWEDGDSNIWLYDGAIVAVSGDNVVTNNGLYICLDAANYNTDAAWGKTGSLENIETSDRVIYVEVTGNDTTGDGLTTGTAFRTIKRALSDILPRLENKCTITIKLGAGDFAFNKGDWNWLNDIFIDTDSKLNITGSVTQLKNTLVFTRDGTDPWKYDVTEGGGTPSFITNAYRDKFLGKTASDSIAKPIYSNNNTQVWLAENDTDLSSYDAIYEIATTITIDAKRTLTAFETKGSGSLYFNELHFKMPDEQRPQQPRNAIKLQMNRCLFETTVQNKRNVYQTKAKQFMNTYYDCIFLCDVASETNPLRGAVRLNSSNAYNCVIRNKAIMTTGVSSGLHITNEWINIDELVIINFPHAICSDGSSEIAFEGDVRVEDCGNVFNFYQGGGHIIFDSYKVYLENTNYVFMSYATYTDIKLAITADMVTGTPNTAWRVPDDTQGVWNGINIGINVIDHKVNYDYDRELYIRMPDEYPATESNLQKILTNNTTTNIIIGDKVQNDSIFIKYNIVRDDEVETNTLQISNNGITVSIREGTLTGDDAGVSFAVAYNVNEIQLQVTLDNDVAGIMKYNIERTMI